MASERLTRSRGLAALEATGLDQSLIADRLTCDRTLVAHWFRRARLPSASLRARMKREWKIDPAWWDEEAPALAVVTVTEADLTLTPTQSTERARRVALRLLREAEADDVPPAERGKRLKAATEALRAVDDLTGESGKITEAKILKHPAFERVRQAIKTALDPEAQLALGKALEALEEDP